MAFDDVTFFELHLDDARFGGVETGDEDEEAESTEYDADTFDEGGSGSSILPLLFGLGVIAAVFAVARNRFAPTTDESERIEIEADAPEIEN